MEQQQAPSTPIEIAQNLTKDTVLNARIKNYLNAYIIYGFDYEGNLIMAKSKKINYMEQSALFTALDDLENFLIEKE